MFDADSPILSSSADRLNRALFAKYLARCMLDHKDTQSLVIGLYGGWGVGKTSLLNLVKEELTVAASNMLDDEKPIVLTFSAWSYSGQDQLIYSFFRRLSAALRSVTYLKNADRIIHLLELYVSFFTHKPIPKPFRSKRSLLQKITFRGGEESYGWESGRDLTLVKAELNELLRGLQHKIIITMDNISRLQPAEIMQIFQIVKSIGDFANTAYLLSLDKEQVIAAINRVVPHSGDAYLEKIVQLPFEVPPILQQDLEAIFADRLKDVMALVPLDTWNKERWADVYHGSLKFFFENCRDITRYVNTLHFSYARLRDVVNPVDFFALTVIEVFIPNVYVGIRDNKDLFTDLLDHVYRMTPDQIQKDKMRCDEILARNHRVSRETLLILLMQLFPNIRRIYQPNIPFYHSDAIARKGRRLCSLDVFDIYFRLSIQAGQIPPLEFETILAMALDTTQFDQALTRLNQDDRIIRFLDLLDSHKLQTIPANHIPGIISALIDNGDLFPSGIAGPLTLDTPMRIHRIIHGLLHQVEKNEERLLMLQQAINNATKSLYIIVHELREQGLEHQEEAETFLPLPFRDLEPQQLQLLQKLAVKRIESWAANGSLMVHPELLSILYAWREWGGSGDAAAFLLQMTSTDRGLIIFLTDVFKKPIAEAMTHNVKNPAWEIYLDDIQAFFPTKQLESHAITLFEDPYFEKLRENEQLALMIFLDLIKAKTTKTIPKTTA